MPYNEGFVAFVGPKRVSTQPLAFRTMGGRTVIMLSNELESSNTIGIFSSLLDELIWIIVSIETDVIVCTFTRNSVFNAPHRNQLIKGPR